MLIHDDIDADCTVVRLAGHLDLAAAVDVRRALLKAMTHQPVAVVGDLAGVSELEPACAAVFSTAWRESGGWPGVSLSLCNPSPRVRARLQAEGTTRFLAVHDDVGTAVRAARDLPPYLSHTSHLRFDAMSASDARTVARSTFQQWRIDEQLDDALLLVSEMVSNCVRHGEPPARLTLRLRSGRLRISVNDAGAGRPRPLLRLVSAGGMAAGGAMSEGGRGLSMVEAVSSTWGVSDYTVGHGKSVWCELRIDPAPQ